MEESAVRYLFETGYWERDLNPSKQQYHYLPNPYGVGSGAEGYKSDKARFLSDLASGSDCELGQTLCSPRRHYRSGEEEEEEYARCTALRIHCIHLSIRHVESQKMAVSHLVDLLGSLSCPGVETWDTD